MRLNIFTDICLKSLIYLKQANSLVTINEIASRFSIPRNHLIKALNLLVRLDWISSIRGRNGGLSYNNKSDILKLGDVILILEAKPELFNCDECILHSNCFLRFILKESLDAFYSNLNKYTIADLVNEKTSHFINQIIYHPKQ